jgi:hypothetical protein
VKDQRGELIEQAGGLDRGRDQDEGGGQSGHPPVHTLEQLVEDHRQRDVGHGDDDVCCQAGPIELLVRLEVGGGGGRIGCLRYRAGRHF